VYRGLQDARYLSISADAKIKLSAASLLPIC
jgi:hypothetical protein